MVMKQSSVGVRRGGWRWFLSVCVASLVLGVASGTPELAQAAQSLHTPYIVRDDYGGSVKERSQMIRRLERDQYRVEIRGKYCFSSCTMMLGIQGVCVQANTVFGFHGPSRQGVRLSEKQFEQVSQLIASYYPPRLRGWYLREARFTLNALHVRTGADLIAMGIVEQCDRRVSG